MNGASVQILDQHGRPHVVANRRKLVAKWDAANTTGTYRDHWLSADYLAPNASASPSVRRRIRSRARYEYLNNSYAFGMIRTLADYVIGTGPVLRMMPKPNASKAQINRLNELSERFNAWAWEIDLAGKLHAMRKAKAVDGEGVGLITSGREVAGVTLDLLPIECDYIGENNFMASVTEDTPDGVIIGRNGYPVQYKVFAQHPEKNPFQTPNLVDAKYVFHWFTAPRLGMWRGVSELAPALTMFAQLRRYTGAVVTAAEAAASISGFMETNLPINPDAQMATADNIGDATEFPVERNMFLSAPYGWKMSQIKAEHPGTMHDKFIQSILREIGRSLSMPYAVAAMDASGHNYSSMRGDWQAFMAAVAVERAQVERVGLENLLNQFIEEAKYSGLGPMNFAYDYDWDWPGFVPIDEKKSAEARRIALESRMTTYASEFSKLGLNWRDQFAQIGTEQELMQQLGIEPSEGKATPGPVPQDDADE